MKNRYLHRYAVLAFTIAATLTVAGCVVAPQQRVAHENHIVQTPPAPLSEVIPPPPYPDAYWIGGHWKWEGNRYVWNNGHWEQSRQNQVFQHPYWSNNGVEWTYHPGRWVALVPTTNTSAIVINVAPPPPRVENLTPAPSPNHVWIGGYWRWNNGEHVWVSGHWEVRRDGYFYAPAHWYRSGNTWTFSGGFWQHY